MHTKKFIEDAIEGGWQEKGELSFNGHWFEIDYGVSVFQMDVPTALLDPEAWQAVGKVRGWELYIETGKFDACYPEGAIEERIDGWLYYWHQFIDALAEGLSIEEALEKIS